MMVLMILNRVKVRARAPKKSIIRIYLGLPEWLRQKVFWVGRKFRTNDLSNVPGGTDVIVEYKEGTILGYDWIKYPSNYIKTIIVRAFSRDGKDFWKLGEDEQIELIIGKVALIYARKYTKENYETVPFENVWDASSDELPWVAIKDWEKTKEEAKMRNQLHIIE